MTPVVINSASGTLEVYAAQTGKRIKLWRLVCTLAAGNLTIKSATTALSGPMATTGLLLQEQPSRIPWYETAVGEALNFVTTDQLSGTAYITVE